MRRTVLIAVASLALAGSAIAQQEPRDPGRDGKVGVDLVAAPALGFGVPIRLTKNLTLRTTVGFGSAATGAAAWSLGSDLRYTLRPDADWSAYLSGQASYLHAPSPSSYRSSSGGMSLGSRTRSCSIRRQLWASGKAGGSSAKKS